MKKAMHVIMYKLRVVNGKKILMQLIGVIWQWNGWKVSGENNLSYDNLLSVWEKTNFQAMKKAMNFIRSHRFFCIL